MPELTANGVAIHYEVHGQGAPAIFIHGGFGGAQSTLVRNESPVLPSLPFDSVRCVTYDRHCAGLSEYVLDWYTLDDLAADARALLEQLDIERSIVIGSSMGGMVALQYALSHPDRVAALALCNTGPALMSQTPWGRGLATIVERAKQLGDRTLFEASKDQLRNPSEPPADPKRLEAVAQGMHENRARYAAAVAQTSDDELLRYSAGMIRNQAAFLGYDLSDRLRELGELGELGESGEFGESGDLAMPTLIVHGTADPTVPFACAEMLASEIPQAELHSIPDALHGILRYPAAQEILRGWLTRQASARPRG